MKLAIMQPYFLPYIGYFQLIGAADTFVIYDNIKYTKKGWINRNRILRNGEDVMFSLNLKKDSDSLDVVQRELATDFDRAKMLGRFVGAYSSAPFFEQFSMPLRRVIQHQEQNLFRYVHNSVTELCGYLKIPTKIVISSDIDIDHSLKGQAKVLAMCEALGASTYINSVGGMELYSRRDFAEYGVDLKFIQPQYFEYAQFGDPFIPWLSIVDVLMFNSLDTVRDRIADAYEVS